MLRWIGSVTRLFLATALLVLAAGCASVPFAPEAEDLAAKRFEIPDEKSNIYVARNSAIATAVLLGVSVDGGPREDLANKTYYVFEVEPGMHKLRGFAPEKQDRLDLETKANKNYFVRIKPKMGALFARVQLEEIKDPAEGMTFVRKCKLAEKEHGDS